METTIIQSPVSFTSSALKELYRLTEENNSTKKLRVGVKGGGCTGLTYVLEFDEVAEDDKEFRFENLSFIMKNAHGLYLQNMTVDYGTGLDARGFIFSNPNASETCGCGQSFAV